MAFQDPVVVVPGITASAMRDEYDVNPRTVSACCCGDADRIGLWREAKPEQRVLTGDGTVPYCGARAAFVPVEKQVCVSADDFGYFEIANRILEAGAGSAGSSRPS